MLATAAALLLPAGASAAGDPVASFTVVPGAPAVGQRVVFTSTSTPAAADVPIVASLWDFEGDGTFDAFGPTVATAFATLGAHTVRLQVVDADGNLDDTAAVVTVGPSLPAPPTAQPAVAPPPAAAPPPVLMAPFPIVRMQGRLVRGGVVITRLTVRAPAGARVRVVCSRRALGCPRRTTVRRTRSPRKPVRLRAFEGRRLRAGAAIQVFVSDPRAIGKYTRFRVRERGAPLRRDLCVAPGGVVPARCPGA